MKRLVTKQMRGSFNVSVTARIGKYLSMIKPCNTSVNDYFESTKKQRILILRRTIK